MKLWQAILLTLFLATIGFLLNLLVYGGVLVVVVGSSLWDAYDSSKLGFKKYKTAFSYDPILLCILMCILWIIEFPWYLSERYKIINHLTPLKYSAEGGNSPLA